MEPTAVGLVEHETLVVEIRADQHPLFKHASAVLAHHGDRALVECDRSTALRGLRLADHHRAARLDDCLHDTKPRRIEVKVGPTQPERLASPHAGCREQDPQRVKPIVRVTGCPEERSQRRRVPRLDAV